MLDDLVKVEVVRAKSPPGGSMEKKMLYRIEDLFFRFWHRFVAQVSLLVKNWNTEPAVTHVRDNYAHYIGGAFEKICSQWLSQKDLKGALPINIFQMGSWWGTDSSTKIREEIDIVASDADGNRIFCECKWQTEPPGRGSARSRRPSALRIPMAPFSQRASGFARKAPLSLGMAAPLLIQSQRPAMNAESSVSTSAKSGLKVSMMTFSALKVAPKMVSATLATVLRFSLKLPSPARVAEVPTHWKLRPLAARRRRIRRATSAPWRPR